MGCPDPAADDQTNEDGYLWCFNLWHERALLKVRCSKCKPFSVRKSINDRLRRMTTKRGRETMGETMNRILPELRSKHRMISTEPSVLP